MTVVASAARARAWAVTGRFDMLRLLRCGC
jgi:hypothetical protein